MALGTKAKYGKHSGYGLREGQAHHWGPSVQCIPMNRKCTVCNITYMSLHIMNVSFFDHRFAFFTKQCNAFLLLYLTTPTRVRPPKASKTYPVNPRSSSLTTRHHVTAAGEEVVDYPCSNLQSRSSHRSVLGLRRIGPSCRPYC